MKIDNESNETNFESYNLSFLYLKDGCIEDLRDELETKKPKVFFLHGYLDRSGLLQLCFSRDQNFTDRIKS